MGRASFLKEQSLEIDLVVKTFPQAIDPTPAKFNFIPSRNITAFDFIEELPTPRIPHFATDRLLS